MLNRRSFSAALLSAFAAPFVNRAMAQTASDIRPAIDALPQLHAMIVQRGDDIVFAEAPRGPGLDRAANIKSCSKSIVALLAGNAIAQGDIAGVNATLGTVAPSIIPPDATPGVADLTIEDLLTLRAGLEGTSGPNYGAWVNSGNWVDFALRRPMIASPGERMIYSTGTTHVLGAALTVATGQSLLEQARSVLGRPLGIEIPPWTRDPQGFYFGGNEMALTPRAMLRIAVLMRDGGQFGGEQILSPDWIRASLRPRTRSPYSGLSYGYGWFLTDSGFVIARGYGGQIIAAHPERDLAVAITSDPNSPARSGGYFGQLMNLLEGPVLTSG
ncbi:CubicO group peptidase, beta-lactamase class C family [Lutimaribacter pacificus]|uniref:CubicO group peptidase, beta-lactamase class C family n=1 Tax=Lutimaribacter pacificus TaxID=391948 RepID=A0A1H0N6B0_9RHOB|nr:serine hydrolase [Lutimaribacter pacificus]SDO88161.1 CubicO group peptidase, beta-lactamase class C family [Lutimaribacter pacificus]SHK86720.1 CubicO group peptidase, beta-lactamase class C family [Lutimaribacter pacificus]